VVLTATGTVGPTGPTGATGVNGSIGATGSTGATGANGIAGSTGATGANGTAGATGATGAAGAAGPSGAAGATGAAGPAGAAGATGAAGPAGTKGATGAAGATGPAGAAGPAGPAGSYGTGATITGIPASISGHFTSANGNPIYYAPTSGAQNTALDPNAMLITPAACTPSMTIWSYVPATIAWNITTVGPSTSTDTWTLGSTAFGCSTSAASGGTPQKCTATGAALGVGLPITLVTSPTTTTAYGFFVAFSCQ
jgi:hypothetical protein